MNEIHSRLHRWVAEHAGEITGLVGDLVRIPTENPPGSSYADCVDLLVTSLRRLDIEHRIIKTGTTSCVLGECGTGEPRLYFHGHYDVVPASREGQFVPRVDEGRLTGRGSSDMKAGLAAMIYAAAALKENNIELDGTIALVMVPDEETGGARGTELLVAQGLLAGGGVGMLTPEPTSGVVWSGSRGAITLRLTVHGTPAHVALHYQGVNAFEQMLVVANELMQLKQEVADRHTAFAVQPEAARRSILMLGGECSSGSSFNTVPAACSWTLERRFNPEEDLETERRRLFALFDRLRLQGIDLEVEILQQGDSSGTDKLSPLATALAESITHVTGSPPSFELCPGLLETRFYGACGIPALGWGPGLLEVSHGPDEYVEIDRVLSCTEIYALTAARLLGRA